MAIGSPFKLDKLKIEAYQDVERTQSVGNFEAMFNPESLKQSYEIVYGRGQGIGSSDQDAPYSYNKPSDLNIKLFLDGTGVHEIGILQLGSPPTVQERVDEFLELTFQKDGEIHEPRYLILKWGDLNFRCRLSKVDVTYTSFDKNGKALRAELDVVLKSNVEPDRRQLQDATSSPDLTHARLVKSGDTLPLLSREIYGSSEHYLFVADFNDLDDFRNLTPGEELLFPPLPDGSRNQASR